MTHNNMRTSGGYTPREFGGACARAGGAALCEKSATARYSKAVLTLIRIRKCHHDEALIQCLPTFDTMKHKPTRGKRPARKGSLASKQNSCIFSWSADTIAAVQKKIVSKSEGIRDS